MKTLFAGICAVTAALFLVFNVSAFSDESSSAELQIGKLLQNQVVDLVCKGDLIGDGVFEYAVLSHKKGSEHYEGGKDAVQYYFDLSVFAKQGSEMKLLWTDGGKYGYYQGLIGPQNTLLGIGDILNNGTKYLVVRFSEDDSYDLLKWKDGKLIIDKEISLSGGKVYFEVIKKTGSELMYGDCSIAAEKDGTKLKILVSNTEEKVLKITGDKYVIQKDGLPDNEQLADKL